MPKRQKHIVTNQWLCVVARVAKTSPIATEIIEACDRDEITRVLVTQRMLALSSDPKELPDPELEATAHLESIWKHLDKHYPKELYV